ncbi:MAG: hypothetical protein AB8B83_07555 [Bdellovibrionales bacterium]
MTNDPSSPLNTLFPPLHGLSLSEMIDQYIWLYDDADKAKNDRYKAIEEHGHDAIAEKMKVQAGRDLARVLLQAIDIIDKLKTSGASQLDLIAEDTLDAFFDRLILFTYGYGSLEDHIEDIEDIKEVTPEIRSVNNIDPQETAERIFELAPQILTMKRIQRVNNYSEDDMDLQAKYTVAMTLIEYSEYTRQEQRQYDTSITWQDPVV